MSGAPSTASVCPPAPKGSRVWWWIVLAFAIQLMAWAAWFIIASKSKVQEVPLATAPITQKGH